MSFFQIMGAITLAFGSLLTAIYMISYLTDPGRFIFAKAVDFLRHDSAEWNIQPGCFSWDPTTFRHSGSGIRVRVPRDWSRGLGVEVAAGGGDWIEVGPGWAGRVRRAANFAERQQERAEQLNAICDGIEALGEKNIIPLRRSRK